MYNFILRLLPDMPEAIEWEVRLHGVPVSDGFGKEVVANWEFPGFQEGHQTFYTDSNGLEMQRRILNFRPDFDLVTSQTASSNYYPVQSAMVMRNMHDI